MWLDPADVVARLRADVPDLVEVGTARDLGAARIETILPPSAWVVVLGETAGEVRYEVCELFEQVVTVRFAVVLGVRDIGDRTGSLATSDLLPIRKEVHRALTAWKPQDANHGCRFARGALSGAIGADGTLFWQDEFTVAFDRRTQLEIAP
ncbi:hypothetical protein [Paracoccus sanguinis]|uniref:DUF1834 family protein n=1 Tax=Paracoccus sanguinis TaxID=1545044 RepID=A0A099GKC8_9RHOB|nr:hypothetical protein [Paracoccus sanguinis]KGJ23274.1 hypothetical protein IX56_03180 [Paracoccus sanguinis]